MNELKFNSQICTTKEQSQHLLDLGLKPETADMSYYILDYEPVLTIGMAQVYRETIKGGKIIGKQSAEIIPAWSLHRLMEILDAPLVEFSISTLEEAYEDIIYNISESIKNGYINKEYLKQ